jgi:hypothetical protein
LSRAIKFGRDPKEKKTKKLVRETYKDGLQSRKKKTIHLAMYNYSD